jgi:serine/threonine-protein kinase
MGTVFKARQKSLSRIVALKVLKPSLARDARYVDRLRREARIVASLSHPNIVGGHDLGEAGGYHYFVMEFLKGRSVADLVNAEGALPMGVALGLVAQLLEVLEKAHAAGVVHRDLKPQNLFVEQAPNGLRLRVLDFGIAKSMTPEIRQQFTGSAILGTPGYMAPEQINSEPVTPRTDLFATGAVLFELLTGRPIFTGNNIGQMLIKALHEDAPRASSVKPDVPAELDALVARLLSRDPAGRPASARDALDEVRALQTTFETQGSTPTRGEVPVAVEPQRRGPVPGIDDRATSQSKSHKPKFDMHEAGQRTEPAFAAQVPGRASNPGHPPDSDDATRPVPKVKSNPARPAPVMHEVVATAIDRQMVDRMKVEASPKSSGTKWVVVLVVLAGVLTLGWFALH